MNSKGWTMDAVSSEDERKEYITDMHGEHSMAVCYTYVCREAKEVG